VFENLQEVAMSSGPIDSELKFVKATTPIISIDSQSSPIWTYWRN
jgi:hypothetical protein